MSTATNATINPTTGKPVMDEAGLVRFLTLQDRCDRCSAQAWIRSTLESTGSQLYFCAHHGREVEAALKPISRQWMDETRFMNEKPSPSAGA